MALYLFKTVIGALAIVWMIDFLSTRAALSRTGRLRRVIGSFCCFFPSWMYMLHLCQWTVVADKTLSSLQLSPWMQENLFGTMVSFGVVLATVPPLLAIYRWRFISEKAGAFLFAIMLVCCVVTFLPIFALAD
jgi:hypothetical protein